MLIGPHAISATDNTTVFNLNQFCYGCASGVLETVVALAELCNLAVTVGSQTLQFAPPSGGIIADMSLANTKYWARGLTKAVFETESAALVATRLDNVRYVIVSKG